MTFPKEKINYNYVNEYIQNKDNLRFNKYINERKEHYMLPGGKLELGGSGIAAVSRYHLR